MSFLLFCFNLDRMRAEFKICPPVSPRSVHPPATATTAITIVHNARRAMAIFQTYTHTHIERRHRPHGGPIGCLHSSCAEPTTSPTRPAIFAIIVTTTTQNTQHTKQQQRTKPHKSGTGSGTHTRARRRFIHYLHWLSICLMHSICGF